MHIIKPTSLLVLLVAVGHAPAARADGYCVDPNGPAYARTMLHCAEVTPIGPDLSTRFTDPVWDAFNRCMDYNTQQVCSFLEDVENHLTPNESAAIEILAKGLPGKVIPPLAGGIYGVLANLFSSFTTVLYAPEAQTLIIDHVAAKGAFANPVPYYNNLFEAVDWAEQQVDDYINTLLADFLRQQADLQAVLNNMFLADGWYNYPAPIPFPVYVETVKSPSVSTGTCFGPPINSCNVETYSFDTVMGVQGTQLGATQSVPCYIREDGSEICL